MEIRIDPHTLERAKERGADAQEIREVILSGIDIPAKYGRKGKAKVYNFRDLRHGKFYEQKRIEVFYLVEDEVIITVTVYVFFGQWESNDANLL